LSTSSVSVPPSVILTTLPVSVFAGGEAAMGPMVMSSIESDSSRGCRRMVISVAPSMSRQRPGCTRSSNAITGSTERFHETPVKTLFCRVKRLLGHPPDHPSNMARNGPKRRFEVSTTPGLTPRDPYGNRHRSRSSRPWPNPRTARGPSSSRPATAQPRKTNARVPCLRSNGLGECMGGILGVTPQRICNFEAPCRNCEDLPCMASWFKKLALNQIV
jgi:hypothetical protein